MPIIPATREAIMDLRKLEAEAMSAANKTTLLWNRANESSEDYLRKAYRRESGVCERKANDIKERAETVRNLGISRRQIAALKAEISSGSSLKTISLDRDIAGGHKTVVGFSKSLGLFVKVTYTKWSSLMGNVSGMRSFAGKVDIDDITKITGLQAKRMTQGTGTATTYFMGAHEKRQFNIG